MGTITIHHNMRVIEPASNLGRKGYFDPRRFPLVAAFHALPRRDQDTVVAITKERGARMGPDLIHLLSKHSREE